MGAGEQIGSSRAQSKHVFRQSHLISLSVQHSLLEQRETGQGGCHSPLGPVSWSHPKLLKQGKDRDAKDRDLCKEDPRITK